MEESSMSPEIEKRILLGFVQQAAASLEPTPARHRAIWVVVALGLMAIVSYGFHIYRDLPAPLMLAVLAGVAVGGVAGFMIAAESFAERMTVLAQVADVDLIRKRLRELGA